MDLSLDFVINSIKGQRLAGSGSSISRVSTDSRQISPGTLFIALKGERFDGHDYILPAIEAGAAAVIVSRRELSLPSEYETAIILVDDTLQALQSLAASYRRLFSLSVIAITGSVGKTTTKDLLADCLVSRFKTLKTQGNFNNEIGLPLTLLNMNNKHQAAVLEMGMRAPGEIHHLASLLDPNYAIITNVEAVHLETMGSLENIARTKCEVLEFIDKNGFALINGDNELLVRTAGNYDCKTYRFGYQDGNDIQIKSVFSDGAGIQVTLKLFSSLEKFYLPLPVSQLASNLAAAAGMAFLLGVGSNDIKAAIKDFKPGGNRMNIIPLAAGGVIIDDSYNANPVSVMAALEACRQMSSGRKKVAVLGDMLELGSYEKDGHLKVGRKAADMEMDILVTIGSLAKYYREGAIERGMAESRIHHFNASAEALEWLKEHVTPEDIVLFKASRGMHLDKLVQDWIH